MTDVPARLLVQYGRYRDQTYEITHLQITIGRSPSNDITFTDPEISRQHVRISRSDDGYTIEDLGSTNGSFVNKERLTAVTRLYHQDMVNLGDAIDLLFVHEPSQCPADLIATPDHTPVNEDEQDTPAHPPPTVLDTPAPVIPPVAVSQQPTPTPEPMAEAPMEAMPEDPPPTSRRRLIMGCGCGLFLSLVLCIGLLFFLDGYEQGRLLYCGPIAPLFETVLGPLGFAPVCP